MIDIDKTIEKDAILSAIKDCMACELYLKIYELAGTYLAFKADWHKIDVKILRHEADKEVLSDIADFLEDKEIEKTVYSILKKIQPICGLITVDGAIVEMKEEEIKKARECNKIDDFYIRRLGNSLFFDVTTKGGFLTVKVNEYRFRKMLPYTGCNYYDFAKPFIGKDYSTFLMVVREAIIEISENGQGLYAKKEEPTPVNRSTKSEGFAGLSIETLKQMGYNYPCTARRIIEDIEQGKDPKSIDSGLIKSLLTAEGHGHIFHSFILSYTKIYPEENPSCKDSKDNILLIDRKWVPSNDRRLLRKVFEAIRDGKSVEEALECLKEEEAEEAVKPEENTQTSKAPNHEAKEEEDPDEDVEEKEEGEQHEATPDPTMEEVDLRNALSFCKDIFEKKLGLYGGSFCFMHPETVTDQLYMKATILKKRLTERDKGERFEYDFFEGVRDEFAAVVNYGIIALRQSVFSKTKREYDAPDDLMQFYLEQTRAALSLICDKSADYGHLWRSQRIGTYADMIYTKVLRVKRIEDQYRVGGLTKEDYRKFAGDQYRDMINYGLFGVVRVSDIRNGIVLQYDDEAEFE